MRNLKLPDWLLSQLPEECGGLSPLGSVVGYSIKMAARKTAPKKRASKKAASRPVKGKQRRIEALPDPERGGGKVRSRAFEKFNQSARTRYLTNLSEWGTKTRSAEAAGVTYQTVRNYLAVHPAFQDEIDNAVEEYRDMLLTEMRTRAVDGWIEQPLFDKDGNHIGDKVKKSDRLLEVALKRVDPESRETISKIEHSGSAVVGTVNFDPAELAGLDRKGRDALRIVLKQIAAGRGGGSDSDES